MMTLRSVTARGISGAIAAAMLATSATPAMADGYRGGQRHGGWGHGNWGHRDHDRIGAGGVIAGIAVLGIIAAIASSGSKSRNRSSGSYSGAENEAADACAANAEQRLGSDARVSNIDQVVRAYDGYQVSGIVETRNYGDTEQQRFTCQVRYGNVERIDFSGGDDRRY